MGIQQAPRRGRLFSLFWPVTSYVVTNVTVTLFWLVFFVFNRTVVIGRRNVGAAPRPARPPSHDSSAPPRRDDAVPGGDPVAAVGEARG